MGVMQPLKGSSNKFYNVIASFDKGIDKKTSDDVADDSSFKNLKNFYNETSGELSKRPGVYNSNVKPFIKSILEGEFSEKFRFITNDFEETPEEVLPRLQDFYDTILCGNKKEKHHDGIAETRYFSLDKIVGFQIIRNNKFLEALQEYEKILNGEYSTLAGSSIIEFAGIIVAGGFTTIKKDNEENEKNKMCGLYITRINLKLEYTTGNGYDVSLEINSVDPTIADTSLRNWVYYPSNYDFDIYKNEDYIKDSDEYKPLGPIDLVSYNSKTYIPSGKDYIIEIEQMPDSQETPVFKIIGNGGEENIYKPTVIETTKIGFNILSSDPLAYIKTGREDESQNEVNKIKGVFYSRNITTEGGITFKQPILMVPYNDSFNMHVLYTGNRPTSIKYRQDNGETDESKNAYKPFPGGWEDDSDIWVCPGLNIDQRYELQIISGDDVFISYIEPGSSIIDETGYINNISKMVLSSKRMKVINNQLVLYGGHGYLFFSEYDIFSYFPNYYYIYIATEAGEEEVTSINYFRQYYALFTNKRIKKMEGAFGSDTFAIKPLNDFVGCSNGYTVKAVGNNIFFLGNDGLYKLKQGYIGEGTENVEKIDTLINGELNLSNVLQSFIMNNYYVTVKNDGVSWYVYNTETEAFYEYNLEAAEGQVFTGNELNSRFAKLALPFYSVFESNLYDSNGMFFTVPMYSYEYNEDYTDFTKRGVDFMTFRFSDLHFLDENIRYKDGYGFISSFETHLLSMGYPTHNKKFKEIYIKMTSNSGHPIPLYITIQVDDNVIISPEEYIIVYNKEIDTYYYVLRAEYNGKLDISRALGEFTLGEDNLGTKTIQQIKLRVGKTGKGIKIKLSDGYDDCTSLIVGDDELLGKPIRNRNNYNFIVAAIGIVYKLKKVKEG